LQNKIKAFAPHRISYCGGGTDFPSFYNEYGGAVINCAINRFSKIYARAESSSKVFLEAKRVNETYRGNMPDLKNKKELSMPLKAILDWKQPVHMVIESDVPSGSGLGSSGTLAVNLINALNFLKMRKTVEPSNLAEQAYHFEAKTLGKAVGKQDHYAAALGGLNFMEFSAQGVKVSHFAAETVIELQKRCVLFYLGKTRMADRILKRQERNVVQRNESTMEALKGMITLTRRMKRSIDKGNFGEIGPILEDAWLLKRKYTTGISNKFIEKVHSRALKSGAVGAKVTGAGGGGHFFVYAEADRHRKIIRNLKDIGCEHIPFKVCESGAWVER
jgi:D-glycero-alpha-D-manno-heptose-7-phosphate kinase